MSSNYVLNGRRAEAYNAAKSLRKLSSYSYEKTAFVSDIADSLATVPMELRNSYYRLKDVTYPFRSAFRISDYGDRLDDKLSQLELLAKIKAVGLNRSLDNAIISPLLDSLDF